MTKDVLIYIKGIQMDMLDSNEIEVVTTGHYYEKNNKIYITYIDNALDEDQPTKTTIKIGDNEVSILRFGGANTHMVFEKGEKHITHYETPLGLFEISTLTKSLEVTRREEEIELDVKYALEVNNMTMGDNSFNVKIKENNSDQTILLDKAECIEDSKFDNMEW